MAECPSRGIALIFRWVRSSRTPSLRCIMTPSWSLHSSVNEGMRCAKHLIPSGTQKTLLSPVMVRIGRIPTELASPVQIGHGWSIHDQCFLPFWDQTPLWGKGRKVLNRSPNPLRLLVPPFGPLRGNERVHRTLPFRRGSCTIS